MTNETVSRETTPDADRRRGCGVDWTEAEISKLKRLRGYGLSSGAIACLMPTRTAQAIRLKLHRLNIVLQPHRSPRLRRMRDSEAA